VVEFIGGGGLGGGVWDDDMWNRMMRD